jgi:hypothetical protein
MAQLPLSLPWVGRTDSRGLVGSVAAVMSHDLAGDSSDASDGPQKPDQVERILTSLRSRGAVPKKTGSRLVPVSKGERDCRKVAVTYIVPSGPVTFPRPCGRWFCDKCFRWKLDQLQERVRLAFGDDVESVQVILTDPKKWGSVQKAINRARPPGAPAHRLVVRYGAADLVVTAYGPSDRTGGVWDRYEVDGAEAWWVVGAAVEGFHLDGRSEGTRDYAHPVIAKALPALPKKTKVRTLWDKGGLSVEDGQKWRDRYHELLNDVCRSDPALPEDHDALARGRPELIEQCGDQAFRDVIEPDPFAT